jgi:hypothetical protein
MLGPHNGLQLFPYEIRDRGLVSDLRRPKDPRTATDGIGHQDALEPRR